MPRDAKQQFTAGHEESPILMKPHGNIHASRMLILYIGTSPKAYPDHQFKIPFLASAFARKFYKSGLKGNETLSKRI